MIAKTESTKTRNRRMRKAEKERQADSALLIGRIFGLPTVEEIESRFSDCPVRIHDEFTRKDYCVATRQM